MLGPPAEAGAKGSESHECHDCHMETQGVSSLSADRRVKRRTMAKSGRATDEAARGATLPDRDAVGKLQQGPWA